MKATFSPTLRRLSAWAMLLAALKLHAAVLYVDVNNANPAPPFTNWTTAATVIQDAVDAATAGDEIVVTNGTYSTGGRAVFGTMTNRVAVDKPLTLRSVNGPQSTVIQGYGAGPGGPVDNDGIRCVYLANGASLCGFTLSAGASVGINGWNDIRLGGGGGVWCESVSAILSNCVVLGNKAYLGGGVYSGTLNNCTLSGNFARSVNQAGYIQGGAGGGALGAVLNNCTLTDNSAASSGGGVTGGVLNNCIVSRNSAPSGGGVVGGTLNNCTVTANSASSQGGGAFSSTLGTCTLNNCIVYSNTAPAGANFLNCTLNHCCTTPAPTNGVGSITLDPQLASATHLSASSPCRGAGSTAYASGTDIDGEAWANPPSIGCDEYIAGAATGQLSVALTADLHDVAVGYAVRLTATIEGRTTSSVWSFGDGLVASNQPYASHAWTTPGNYAVVLRAYNDSFPAGVSATSMVHVTQPVHYVSTTSTNPLPPYNSWETAATNIQDAVDAATQPGALVLVTNGTYTSAGRAVFGTMTNRVAVTKPLTLKSVNGPEFTFIEGRQVPGTTNGDGAIRCVYLTGDASLSGFTLTKGATRNSGDVANELAGGGVWCKSASSVISNCTLTCNSAGYLGGGVYGGTLNDCTLTANSAGNSGGGAKGSALKSCTLTRNLSSVGGGGADQCTLDNCTLTDNSALWGGGAYFSALNNCLLTGNSSRYEGGGADQCTLNNCLVYFNTAPDGANFLKSTLNYCCTTPQPADGVGNITNAPLFVDQDGGNFHLQSNSPCINAGNDFYVTSGTDLDGNPRIVGGTVDIGAYEYRPPLTFYVSQLNSSPAWPYQTWATAATNIQDAVDAAQAGDEIVVTNGTYATGGRAVFGTMTNRVAVDKPLTLRSVNGPQFTIIQGHQVLPDWAGDGAIRCVYLTNGASLSGFTLTNGATRMAGDDLREQSGGGVWCESATAVLSNCVIVDCFATSGGGGAYQGTLNNCTFLFNYGFNGGGASSSTLNGCTLNGNWASGEDGSGGGARGGILNNCTLTGNSAREGGGASKCTLTNCTLIGNFAEGSGGGAIVCTLTNCTLTANSTRGGGGGAEISALDNCTVSSNYAGFWGGGTGWSTNRNSIIYFNAANSTTAGDLANCIESPMLYCCTTPLPFGVSNGGGNITNAPIFVDSAGGNFRLQSNSPCINAGNNSYVTSSTDLDGNPRIVGGTVDIGAYEFQSPSSLISYAWLQQFGLPTDGSVDNADLDGDGHNNRQEWKAGTNPTNKLSALRMLNPVTNSSGLSVRWQSVTDRIYFVERATNLNLLPAFLPLKSNLTGQASTTTYSDTNVVGAGPFFYRVGVQE